MKSIIAFVCLVSACAAADLTVLPEYVRIDPFGQVVQADRGAALQPARTITLDAARAGYVSCRLVVALSRPGAYSLSVSGPLETELYREWFHLLPASKLYYPDALIPAAVPHRTQLPSADNRIANQTAQSYWLDIWVPADATAGRAHSHSDGRRRRREEHTADPDQCPGSRHSGH